MAAHRHDDSDDDTYVRIGSAFQLLETDEDLVKYKEKKLKEQYVLDKQGRRRFHGAFTGGYSAGYYNTVGSKEGWTPSSFSSSRSSKIHSKRQLPEDFMDEEDLDMFGIAPREISTRDPFTKEIKNTSSSIKQLNTVIPGAPPIQDLVKPTKSTIGAKLLKAMGWREGQGVGPKISRPIESFKIDDGNKVYGCSLPPNETLFMFAPNDVAPWKYHIKEDTHGIGYHGMDEQDVLLSSSTSKSIYGMSGQAFGVGALEEEDADIYGQESITSYNTTISSDKELNKSELYGWTGSSFNTWSLEMFAKMTYKWHPMKKYKVPDVPKNFVALHVFTKNAPEVNLGTISHNERYHALADTSEQSVFNYVNLADRERIKRLANKAKPKDKHKDKFVKSNIGQTIISGNFQPFATNPSKQLRYEAYLSGKRKFNDSEFSNYTEWEKQKELDEFYRKSKLLKPLSTSLSDKFTPGKTNDDIEDEQNPESSEAAKLGMFGVMTRETCEWHPHKMLCKRFNIPNPYPESDIVGVPVTVINKRKVVEFESSTDIPSDSESDDNDEMEIESAEVEEVPRPSHDTFVSIFAENDDEEHDTITNELQDQLPNKSWQNLSLISSVSTNISSLPSSVTVSSQPITISISSSSIDDTSAQEELFGPLLPPDDLYNNDNNKTKYFKKRKHSSSHKKAKHKSHHKH